MPSLSNFEASEIHNHTSKEAAKNLVQTTSGFTEASLFGAFQGGNTLHDAHLRNHPLRTHVGRAKTRQVPLAGGSHPEMTVFSAQHLSQEYQYADGGNAVNAFDLDELSRLEGLAEFRGWNKLLVRRPSPVAAAVHSCLTRDRFAHLAVNTGERACGGPGQSSPVFRAMHGGRIIDSSVIEQLIAPILRKCDAERSAVFDAVGGATVKRLQAPDEVLMFVADNSAAVRQATDFPTMPRFRLRTLREFCKLGFDLLTYNLNTSTYLSFLCSAYHSFVR